MTLRDRKQEFVRDAIWNAAIDLFADKGFDETTVDDIVAAAGTSRRTFFRYFESKRDLMAYPVLRYGQSLKDAIDACPRTSSLAELFHHVVTHVAEKTVSDPRTRKVMEIAAKYPAARDAQLSCIAEIQDEVAEAFARRCKDDLTPHLLAGLTLSTLSIVYRVWFASGKKDITGATLSVLGKLAKITA